MQNYLFRSLRAGLIAALPIFVPLAGSAATTTCSTVAACVLGNNTASGLGVEGTSSSGYGVEGTSETNDGVVGKTAVNATSPSLGKAGVSGYDSSTNKYPYNSGVYGVSKYATGVQGRSTYRSGVIATSSSGIALFATTGTPQFSGYKHAGLFSQSSNGPAIVGYGKNTGVLGVQTDNCAGYSCDGLLGYFTDYAGVEAVTAVGGLGLQIMTDLATSSKTGIGAEIQAGGVGVDITADSGHGGYPALIADGTLDFPVGTTPPGSDSVQGAIISGYNGASITSYGTAIALSGGSHNNPTIVAETAFANGVVFQGQNSAAKETSQLDDAGNLILAGTLTQQGTITSELRNTDGTYSASYSPNATMPTVEDMGEANVVSGAAFVTIDPALRKSIDVSKGYLVFLTPQGSTTGLYVTNKSAAGFRVREIGNARDSLAFDYRIVAHPYAERGLRLATMSAALLPTNHKKLFYRHLKPLRFNNGKLDKSSLPVASM